jgi:uncharacterized membrane protein HdeD (DUF308 family)
MPTTSYELKAQWGWMALRGGITILFGILALIWPQLALMTLIILFGIYALLDGATTLAFMARGGRASGGRGWALFITGIAGLTAGILALFWPGVTAVTLLYVIAAWAIARGAFEVVAAVQLREVMRSSVVLGFAGVLSVAFGIALFAWPGGGLLAMVWLVALYALAAGLALLITAFGLRGVTDEGSLRREPPRDGATPA